MCSKLARMGSPSLSDRLRNLARVPAMHLESWFSHWLPYRPERPNRRPERHYQRLRAIDELARYSVIVGYCDHFKRGGAVLDLGCGEGVLAQKLGPQRYSRYLGVDSSSDAIGRAAAAEDGRTRFAHADAAQYRPDGRFDLIVFNESLYYFADPVGCLRRYEPSLTADGVFVVSLYGVSKNLRLWKRIEAAYQVEDAVRVSHGAGRYWLVKALAPRRRG